MVSTYSDSRVAAMGTDTIHTALLDIARDGDDSILLSEGLSLVRHNDQLLAHRWDWVQGQGEMEAETKATRYLVCEYPQWVQGEEWGAARERGADRFYTGLMAIQVIKPIRTLGFVYRRQEVERRKLCDCLGAQTLVFPNWHSKPDAPTYTVEEIAIPLFVLRNELAHGADLRTAKSQH